MYFIAFFSVVVVVVVVDPNSFYNFKAVLKEFAISLGLFSVLFSSLRAICLF